jgi:hypothetical protein
MRRRTPNVAAAVAIVVVAASAFVTAAGAQTPPLPDAFRTYGRVSAEGQNIVPAEQAVLALVNGRVCGEDRTFVATAQPGNPPEDVGRTVYAIDVSAAGDAAGQLPGCGRNGDPVVLYFPESKRVAVETPAFESGAFKRNNLILSVILGNAQAVPLVASDGTY